MISYKIETRQIDEIRTEDCFQFVGLSTDEKPINSNVGNGSSFFEIDTSDVYFFDKENQVWVKCSDAGYSKEEIDKLLGNYLRVEGGNE